MFRWNVSGGGYDGSVEICEGADQAGLSAPERMSQAAEAKIRADGQARILEEAEHERRLPGSSRAVWRGGGGRQAGVGFRGSAA